MKINKKILHVIDSMALVPVPAHFVADVVKVELPFLKRFKFGNNRFSLPDKKLFNDDRGYDGMELTLWGLFDEYWRVNEERRNLIKNSGIKIYTFHGCFEGCPKSLRGYYMNLAENNPDTFAAIRAQIDLVVDLSQNDEPLLIFHPGFCPDDISREQAIKNVINNLKPHLDYARERNVMITLENMDYKPEGEIIFYDHSDFEILYNNINHSNLRTTFDWGHMNTNCHNPKVFCRIDKNGLNEFKHISEFINKINTKIIHAHVHYNNSHNAKGFRKKRNYLNDLVYLIFFWTETVKFLNQGNIGISSHDKHLPFNRISKRYFDLYHKTVRELLEKTSLLHYKYFTHEISPKKIFKYFTFSEEGAEYKDLIKSLGIFKGFSE